VKEPDLNKFASMQKEKTLVLIDGSSLAFRSFFALFNSGLRTKTGLPTWAILGFFNSLFELIEKFKPEMLAVSFDLAEPTFRHIEFKDYKAHRPEMPDDLSAQWPLIKEGVEKLGLPVYELAGYEADDLIGTIARAAAKENLHVLILTGDQDAFQLIDEQNGKIKVLMPGKQGLQLYGRQEVFDKLGVWPEQIADYKGLCGDSSDNIPGVRGIGPKTAQQLLTTYGNIEQIYKHIDEIKAKGVHDKLVEGQESAHQSKGLATIDEKVPIDLDFDNCQLTPPDITALNEFFSNLEFKTLVNRLPKILKNFNSGELEDNVPAEPVNQNQISSSAQLITLLPENAIINSEADLDKLIKTIEKQSVISLYIQATTEEPIIVGYAFAWAENKSIRSAYIPIKQLAIALTNQQGLDRQLVNKKLAEIFVNSEIHKIVYDSKSVLNLLSKDNLSLKNITFDPALASYIYSPDQKHSLHEQAERLLNYSIEHRATDTNKSKKAGKPNNAAMLSGINLAEVANHACEDARLTLALANHYATSIDKDQQFLLEDMDLPLSTVLAKIEQYGVSLDLSFLKQLSKELDTELKKLEQNIYKLAGYAFNINSTQQLQKVLFEELKLATKTKTKTGFSTDASVLEALKNEHEIIPSLLDYRQLTKLKSTYVDALPKMISPQDGRLHGEFNQTVTSTGRLSSSNPNLQNIPIRTEIGRSIRKAFVPGNKKWFLLSADYSQIELRLLAHMSGDDRLIDAFKKDQDIHARTAGEIFDQPIEKVSSDMRRIGKTLNFALIYQQGPYATARDLGVSTKEASAFIDKYFSRYSKVKTFMEGTIASARQTGYAETLWKRRRYFKFLNDRNEGLKRADERAACNAPLQGSAADLMKLAMIRLDRELSARKLQAKLILQVHDELVLEVPENELDQVKEIVVDAMLMDQPFKVPLKVDVSVGHNWMELK
jgi:DNA polymerase I